ncbi:MAG: porin [Gammaproteobacteria bacterium]
MNKNILALALLGALGAAAGSAQAQSAVTIYGIVDAGLVAERGGANGNVTRVSSGVGSASRLGFRGAEDLGNGLSAIFVLEAGARIDTGEIDSSGTLFNRQAYVGVKSASLGSLSLGRQYTPYYLALSTVADPFGAGYAGSAKNLFPAAGNNTRVSNSLVYSSPVKGGFNADLLYALGEQAGSNTAGRQIGASVGYTAGKFNARLAYNYRDNDLTAAAGAAQNPPVAAADRQSGRNTLLAANYDFTVARAYAAVSVDKGLNSAVLPNANNPYGAAVRPVASLDSRDYLLGASVPLSGANTLLASWIRKDDRSFRDQDADQWAVGFLHALSKRTSLYAAYARIDNKRGAGYTVGNNTDVGSGDSAVNLGVRHTF